MIKNDTCLDGCSDPTITLSALDSVVQTFKVKMTVRGGFEYTSEEITINKMCKTITNEYTLIYNLASKTENRTLIELPFLNIGDEDECGIKEISLIGIENEALVIYPTQDSS